MQTSPLLGRELSPKQTAPVLDEEEQSDEEVKEQEPILCRSCGQVITHQDRKVTKNGSHSHTFFNPMGIVFKIGCFSQAPGCAVHGPASNEFSWFAGHSWRYASCSGCGAHLGWLFQAAQGTSFHGLILAQLTDRQ